MGFKIRKENFNNALKNLRKDFKVYAPSTLERKGTFSDTDSIRYKEISSVEEINFKEKSNFSFKEVVLPITETLFYFTEDNWIEPKTDKESILIFLRSCDLHGLKRIDQIYLKNGAEDPYYKAIRERVKFVIMGCNESFENCFCVSMKTNKSENYNLGINIDEENVYVDIKDNSLEKYFNQVEIEEKLEVEPKYVKENKVKVNISDKINLAKVVNLDFWNEYSERCIACGRCNFVCPTCTCFTMQDIFYKDNAKSGERRRVWASCQIDGYTNMAGGHGFRIDKGQRMRFKVMHKVNDYQKRFGYHMCVGCGRCDDVCPEYISFSNCVNKLSNLVEGVNSNDCK
ncbi:MULTISPECIES: anaerobic sulfite reductase subunit AsrA [Clostridium]|uniref:Anaerobic sulfite reductase subunit A n=1 Tax=Clostridium sporogenes TaxID=1509 RepID=A0A7X5PCI3_CLOSG|nr:anaerobic sulfite reductase subunit AsrA [Clostridium sporogenes]AJD30481.1 sulfite reductase, subunit A [Clostridium botulinum Prevot_594]KRU41416.1 subunit A of sulfite reductase [Clostridium sporogenes]KYN77817.1 sulfite reductase subunit A [Clostridium sporogenes]MBY7013959.1 anaerobic sulfite reductase subunit A [Clostridium sporogenes]MBY7063173.1 anaerobic sulfite reductase subunit A [Clostridium sporogenes]